MFFKKKSLLENVQPADSPIAIHNIAGVTYAKTIGYVPNFLYSIYVCENGIAIILSFAKVKETGCAITYNHGTDAFIVQGPNWSITFDPLLSGLYGHHMPSTGVCLIDTFDSLAEGYSPWQVAHAKAAWKAMSMMGSLSSATLKLMMHDNLINNCPVILKAM